MVAKLFCVNRTSGTRKSGMTLLSYVTSHRWALRVKSDRRAFWSQLFAANRLALQGFLRRRVAPAWDVQDLAQEVYVRMLRVDERQAEAIRDPRAYLFTVASNLVKEHAMLQKRRASSVDVEQVLLQLVAPQGSAEDSAEREFRRQRLQQMLDRLPVRCRAVLVMQHRDGMNYQEIAERFGVSTHMVKKYVVKALTLCRKDLVERK